MKRVRSMSSRKSQAALAVAVSLWLAGAGIAGATDYNLSSAGTTYTVGSGVLEGYTDGDTITFGADNVTLIVPAGKNAGDVLVNGHKNCKIQLADSTSKVGWIKGKADYSSVTGSTLTVEGNATSMGEVISVNPGSGNNITNQNINVSVKNVKLLTNGVVASGAFITADGFDKSVDAENNTVELDNVTVVDSGAGGGKIYGSLTEYGKADNNTVTITNGSNVYGVYGGQGGKGANSNTVSIDASTVNNVNIFGGWLGENGYDGVKSTNDNKITITNSTINGQSSPNIGKNQIAGGFDNSKNSSDALRNEVTIKDSTVGSMSAPVYIWGGRAGSFASAGTKDNGNKVTISGGEVNAMQIFGGYNGGGAASGNEVDIGNVYVQGYVAGGFAYDEASDNKLTINSGTYRDKVYGGYSSTTGNSGSNTVTIKGGTFNSNAEVYGGKSVNGTAIKNSVTIDGGTLDKSVIAGQGRGDATENVLNISDGTFNGIIIGGDSDYEKANDNKITITGGYFYSDVGSIIGGRSYDNDGDETSNGNTVNIKGGTFANNLAICGGYSFVAVSNNTVNITGGTFAESVAIYGGLSAGGDAKDNTINISKENLKVAHLCAGDGGSAAGNKLVLNATGVEANGDGGVIANTVSIGSNVAFDTTKTVLKGSEFYVSDLDISGATKLADATSGSMTLLESAKADDFTTLKVTYDGGSVTFDGTTTSKVVKAGAESTSAKNGVTLTSTSAHTISLSDVNSKTKNAVKYSVDSTVNKVSLGEITWAKGTTARTLTAEDGFKFAPTATVDGSGFKLTTPETVAASDTMILLDSSACPVPMSDVAAVSTSQIYTYLPVAGVTLDGVLTGSYAASGGKLAYTATANQATKLTFGNVAWKDSGALIDHATTLSNVKFAGADVDTTSINFTNKESLAANKKTTLVASFGDSVGTITGTKYKVGSTLEGEGKASLEGEDLVFTTSTATGADGGGGDDAGGGDAGGDGLTLQEQTHNTVMSAEVGMAALAAGNEFIGAATEGLSMAANAGADGVATFAKLGGGTLRQDTGSHIDTHTWNAILAVGHRNEQAKADIEYGAFFEYGTGSYTTHNGAERGDGSTKYTGGGLLGKYSLKNGAYVEGSLRLGTMHDNASNVLRDAWGNPYSYETDASYWGFHVGVGKVIDLTGGHSLDVYGKYFFNHRGSVSFDAGGHYDLDGVNSKVMRLGTRYTVKKDKWSFYGGVAVEHEFGGEAAGRAEGLAIRGADVSGTSFRGELGATVKPSEKSPFTVDFNLTGFAGKKRGLSGGVAAVLHF